MQATAAASCKMANDNQQSRGEVAICPLTRSKSQVRANYDRLSRWYDLIGGWSEQRFREIGLQQLAPVKGETILELGFGTGHCIQALAQSVGMSGRVHGIDLSQGMVRVTQERVRKARLLDRIDLICGEATHLPYALGVMDAVFISFVLELFEASEIPLVLQECQRVLRVDGRIGVVALSPEPPTLMMKCYEWLHNRFPNYIDCRPIVVQNLLRAAGFEILDLKRKAYWGLQVAMVLAKKPPLKQQ